MTFVGLLGLYSGVFLLWCGVTGRSPREELAAVLSGGTGTTGATLDQADTTTTSRGTVGAAAAAALAPPLGSSSGGTIQTADGTIRTLYPGER